jgi:hypothetical protein
MDLSIEKQSCEPRASIEISGSLRAMSKAMPFRHYVRIVDADSGQQHLLEITGRFEPTVKIVPEQMLLCPDALAGESAQGKVIVANHGGQTVTIREPQSLPSGLRVQIDRAIVEPGQHTAIRIMAASSIVRRTTAELQFPSSHPTEPTIFLNVVVQPKNALEVVPPVIRLGVLNRRILQTMKVSISLEGQLLRSCQLRAIRVPEFLQPSPAAIEQLQCQGTLPESKCVLLRLGCRPDEVHLQGWRLSIQLLRKCCARNDLPVYSVPSVNPVALPCHSAGPSVEYTATSNHNLLHNTLTIPSRQVPPCS